MDVDAIMGNAASSPKKSKKNNTPTFEVKGKTAKAIKQYVEQKRIADGAKANMDEAKEGIVPEARRLHSEEVERQGKPLANIKLVAGDLEVQVDVAKEQYSKININEEEELRERFGDDYNELFSKEREVKLTKTALEDKNILVKLIKAVGKDNFAKYFDVTDYIKPTSKFHADRFLSGDDRVKDVIEEELVKPFAIAIRG